MDSRTAQRLIEEIAPLIEGALVSEVRSEGPGSFLLRLRRRPGGGSEVEQLARPEGPAADPAAARGADAGVLGIVTSKAMPLIFVESGDRGSRWQGARERRSPLSQAAGSVIASLRPAGSGAVLELVHTNTAGRKTGRALSISLGKGRDEGDVGGNAEVTWWHDRSGRLHVRLSSDGAPARSDRESRAFRSYNEAACFMFGRFWPELESERRRSQMLLHVGRRLKRVERAIEKVRTEIEDSGRAEEYRHIGQLLLTRQDAIPRGRAEATVTDYDGTTRVAIRINPSLGIQQNAEVYFRKARKAERRGIKAPRRLRELEREAESLRNAAREIAGADRERLEAMEGEIEKRDSRQQAGSAGTRTRFRTYVVSGGWEVLVGKSGRDNDELTHKLARPGDLWFHARQVPGSHVILRRAGSKAEPDRQAILEAAAIAAYHSKAGKSSKVSVCYTERRHVRKARGGQPGEAVVSREKVVMVRPQLPGS